MNVVVNILNRTIFGLSPSYYKKHLIVALIMSAVINIMAIYLSIKNNGAFPWFFLLAFFVVSIILSLVYPYARFVCDLVVDAITSFLSGVVVVHNGIFDAIFKKILFKYLIFATSYTCSFFLAPIGWIILFFMNKPGKESVENTDTSAN
ncbi:hypothetical protein [Basilea psittacipulmonis]|uniref:Uncharacterized protein n=1 Tax=Basilea psittacipulmonis DSM 24701 TaxID=1072685 RepID=A0A077DES8_9BURK|nr:hypothetical protein [Basilea psittacipulmonis]AIL33224.1 hypothetical protein IX83_07890 [Basilea psittacipulmonis DSM 24701]